MNDDEDGERRPSVQFSADAIPHKTESIDKDHGDMEDLVVYIEEVSSVKLLTLGDLVTRFL